MVEGSDTISRLEANNTFSNGLRIAGNIIAMVKRPNLRCSNFGLLPILGVGAGDNISNKDLAGAWNWHRNITNLDA